MLTYLKKITLATGQLNSFNVLKAGSFRHPRFGSRNAIPAGRYDVYRQGLNRVLVPAGQKQNDSDGTFYYVAGKGN